MRDVLTCDNFGITFRVRWRWPFFVIRPWRESAVTLASDTSSGGAGITFLWSRIRRLSPADLEAIIVRAEASGEEWARQYREWEAGRNALRTRSESGERLH